MHLGERPGTTSSRSGSVASCLGLNRVEPTAWGASVAEPRFNGQARDDARGGRRTAISTVAQTSTVRRGRDELTTINQP